jgi:hypothetical protein
MEIRCATPKDAEADGGKTKVELQDNARKQRTSKNSDFDQHVSRKRAGTNRFAYESPKHKPGG